MESVLKTRLYQLVVKRIENPYSFIVSDFVTVLAIKANTSDDVNTILNFLFFEHEYYDKSDKERIIQSVEKAYKDNDFIFIGINSDDIYYYMSTRNEIVNNLLI